MEKKKVIGVSVVAGVAASAITIPVAITQTNKNEEKQKWTELSDESILESYEFGDFKKSIEANSKEIGLTKKAKVSKVLNSEEQFLVEMQDEIEHGHDKNSDLEEVELVIQVNKKTGKLSLSNIKKAAPETKKWIEKEFQKHLNTIKMNFAAASIALESLVNEPQQKDDVAYEYINQLKKVEYLEVVPQLPIVSVSKESNTLFTQTAMEKLGFGKLPTIPSGYRVEYHHPEGVANKKLSITVCIYKEDKLIVKTSLLSNELSDSNLRMEKSKIYNGRLLKRIKESFLNSNVTGLHATKPIANARKGLPFTNKEADMLGVVLPPLDGAVITYSHDGIASDGPLTFNIKIMRGGVVETISKQLMITGIDDAIQKAADIKDVNTIKRSFDQFKKLKVELSGALPEVLPGTELTPKKARQLGLPSGDLQGVKLTYAHKPINKNGVLSVYVVMVKGNAWATCDIVIDITGIDEAKINALKAEVDGVKRSIYEMNKYLIVNTRDSIPPVSAGTLLKRNVKLSLGISLPGNLHNTKITYEHPGINEDGVLPVLIKISKAGIEREITLPIMIEGINERKSFYDGIDSRKIYDFFKRCTQTSPAIFNEQNIEAVEKGTPYTREIAKRYNLPFPEDTLGCEITYSHEAIVDDGIVEFNIVVKKSRYTDKTKIKNIQVSGIDTQDEIETRAIHKFLSELSPRMFGNRLYDNKASYISKKVIFDLIKTVSDARDGIDNNYINKLKLEDISLEADDAKGTLLIKIQNRWSLNSSSKNSFDFHLKGFNTHVNDLHEIKKLRNVIKKQELIITEDFDFVSDPTELEPGETNIYGIEIPARTEGVEIEYITRKLPNGYAAIDFTITYNEVSTGVTLKAMIDNEDENSERTNDINEYLSLLNLGKTKDIVVKNTVQAVANKKMTESDAKIFGIAFPDSTKGIEIFYSHEPITFNGKVSVSMKFKKGNIEIYGKAKFKVSGLGSKEKPKITDVTNVKRSMLTDQTRLTYNKQRAFVSNWRQLTEVEAEKLGLSVPSCSFEDTKIYYKAQVDYSNKKYIVQIKIENKPYAEFITREVNIAEQLKEEAQQRINEVISRLSALEGKTVTLTKPILPVPLERILTDETALELLGIKGKIFGILKNVNSDFLKVIVTHKGATESGEFVINLVVKDRMATNEHITLTMNVEGLKEGIGELNEIKNKILKHKHQYFTFDNGDYTPAPDKSKVGSYNPTSNDHLSREGRLKLRLDRNLYPLVPEGVKLEYSIPNIHMDTHRIYPSVTLTNEKTGATITFVMPIRIVENSSPDSVNARAVAQELWNLMSLDNKVKLNSGLKKAVSVPLDQFNLIPIPKFDRKGAFIHVSHKEITNDGIELLWFEIYKGRSYEFFAVPVEIIGLDKKNDDRISELFNEFDYSESIQGDMKTKYDITPGEVIEAFKKSLPTYLQEHLKRLNIKGHEIFKAEMIEMSPTLISVFMSYNSSGSLENVPSYRTRQFDVNVVDMNDLLKVASVINYIESHNNALDRPNYYSTGSTITSKDALDLDVAHKCGISLPPDLLGVELKYSIDVRYSHIVIIVEVQIGEVSASITLRIPQVYQI